MNWRDKKVLVIGMARSGVAVAEVLAAKGSQVTICDKKDESELKDLITKMSGKGINVIAGKYPEVTGEKFNLVIPSPGVPLDIPPIQQAYGDKSIYVWSEIELAYRMSQGEIVAVTGTNGKTTTTSLIGQMFSDAGMPTIVAGNIGKPLVREIQNSTPEHRIIVEVSSFQLETIHNFRPKVAVFLNLTPDHLDRHKTFNKYKRCKMNIFKNQEKDDWAVLNYDDLQVREMKKEINSKAMYFSQKEEPSPGVYIKDDQVIVDWGTKKDIICPVEHIKLRGSHNLENCLAAIAAGVVLNLPKESVAHTLHTFAGVEHRLEYVREINGVTFVNDSKGTNPEASLKALEAYSDKPIILLAGGMDKGSDFSLFAEAIQKGVKNLILLGETAPKIAVAVEKIGFKDYYYVKTLKEAVHKAWELACPGDVILLSPACASWDMFKSYEERGELFKAVVNSLGG